MQNEKIKRLLLEPLLHFLLIGIGLFVIYSFIQPSVSDDSNRIVVTSVQKDQIIAQYKLTWLRPPTEEEFNWLVESYVRDEVYYREALALGLDQNDVQIRQRLRQKLDFILEDLTTEETNEETLSLFLKQHPDKFQQPALSSFQQLYLNPDKHQDLTADAAIILQSLREGSPPETQADQTMLPFAIKQQTQSEIARQFGDEFAREVVELKPGEWAGPIYSSYGGHLVKVIEKVPGRLPELSEVYNEVAREYLSKYKQEMKDSAYKKMLKNYEVEIEQASPDNNDNHSVASSLIKNKSK